jgi:ATP-dependent DNA helicase RecQ
MQNPRDILKTYWGYDGFRPLQEEVILAVLEGRDVLALLPTGGGKSVCYQVPALCSDGIALVVSPLIALMQDQVGQLRKKGIPVLIIQNGMTWNEIRKTLQQAAYGNFKFLFVSPERLQTALFREFLPAMTLSLIAVDEAHCISQWGYDFRPSYLNIAATSEEKPEVPLLALTATATREVQQDILVRLGMKDPAVFLQSFRRPNLSYSVIRSEARLPRLTGILKKVDGSAIVYCRSRKRSQEVAQVISDEGISASFYHAGLNREQRDIRQEDWLQNRIRVMVCTNAFGMGIDKPDVRLVIHADAPDNLESYGQEAGRAGRDGRKAYAVLLWDPSDHKDREKIIADRFPPLTAIRAVYHALANHLQVPAGSGEEDFFDLDLPGFCSRFKFPVQLVLNVMQTLQQESVLAFQESAYQPSRIEVLARKERLESFEKQHPEAGELLKALLRAYGGILDSPVPVSEKQLAFTMKRGLQEVTAGLHQLDAAGMIRYAVRKDSPQVRFLQERIRATDLVINIPRYEQRKQAFTRRLDAMNEYMGTDGCRSAFMEKYYGSEPEAPCGVCDNCIRERKSGMEVGEFERIAGQLMEMIREGQADLDGILASFPGLSGEKARKVLKEWSEEQKIRVEEGGRITMG